MSLSKSAVSDETAWAAVPAQGFLKRYCQYAATQTDAAIAFQIGVGLTILSSCIPKEITLFRNGKSQYLNLYTILVGDSVLSRKTTSIEIGLTIAADLLGDTIVPSPDSWQGLLNAIAQSPKSQVLVLEPEFSRFLSQSSGHGYLTGLKLGYTDIYDGGNVGRVTKDATTAVTAPFVSLLAGVAPIHIEDHMTMTDFTGGFWARFLVVQADAGEYKPYNDARPEVRSWVQGLLRFYAAETPPEWLKPMDVHPDAKVRIGEWGRITTAHARSLGPTDVRRGIIGRSQLIVQKVAAILAYDRMMWRLWQARKTPFQRAAIVAEGVQVLECDVVHAEAVTQIHTYSAINVSTSIASTPNMRNRRRVLEVALAASGVVSEGFMANQAGLLLRDLRPIIETLEAEGLLTRTPGATPTDVRWIATATEKQLVDFRRAAEAPPAILKDAPVPVDAVYPEGMRMNTSSDGQVVFHD